MPVERVTLFCFAASYAVALAVETVHLFWPRPVQRLAAAGFAAAGLLAHSIYLAVQRPPLAAQYGSLLFLAWILAVFYLYGSLHHRRFAWGVFALPLVLGLVLMAAAFAPRELSPRPDEFAWGRFWGIAHGGFLLLAAVGVCVGFLASVMYLVQAARLRSKLTPGPGTKMLSLERLEEMNRRAIVAAFPLLTAGVLVGAALLIQDGDPLQGWNDPKVLGAVALWVVFAVVLYLRYGRHLRGRPLALWTIFAFVLLLLTLATPAHRFTSSVGP
jgi:ABC-type transport system involved in cytochrome c biogenesis permease subunit